MKFHIITFFMIIHLAFREHYNKFIFFYFKLMATRLRMIRRYCNVLNHYLPLNAQTKCNKHFPSYLDVFLLACHPMSTRVGFHENAIVIKG